MAQISFGDNVRVRPTPETESLGLAGAIGQVYGETTPSVTGVEVVGELGDDRAFAVQFDDRADGVWFGADALDLVDHAPGTEIKLDGVPKTWTRAEDGSWIETKADAKPWWKFW